MPTAEVAQCLEAVIENNGDRENSNVKREATKNIKTTKTGCCVCVRAYACVCALACVHLRVICVSCVACKERNNTTTVVGVAMRSDTQSSPKRSTIEEKLGGSGEENR